MAIYTKESLENLRDRIDLVEVIGAHMELKRMGASFKGLCPFHDEKSPSFMIQKGDKTYHCFGCGAHGDAIQFLTQHVKMTFGDAVENLAERFHVKLEKVEGTGEATGPSKAELKRALELASEFYQFHLFHTQEGQEALTYLEERGFTIEFIKRFDLGWAPNRAGLLKAWLNSKKVSNDIATSACLLTKDFKDFFNSRIMIPIKDSAGSVIGFSGRKIKEEVYGGKYINTSETPLFKKSKVLFGLDQSRKRIAKDRRAIVVEGQLDCFKLIHAGLNFTVAGQGTAFGEGHVRELMHLGVSEVFLMMDGDEAGQLAAVKIGQIFQKLGVETRVVELPKGHDPDSFIKQEGIDRLLMKMENSGGYLPFLLKIEGRGLDLSKPAVKSALVKKIADQIKGWDTPLMVHESLRFLADLAQVPEEFLGIGEKHPTHMLIKKSAIAGSMEINPDKILEKDLIRWLIHVGDARFLQTANLNLTLEDFFSESTREVYKALTEGEMTTLSFEAQGLLQELESKVVPQDRKEQLFLETLQKILDRTWLRKREDVKIKIQSNRYSEDEVLALVKEFDLLRKQAPIIKKQDSDLNG